MASEKISDDHLELHALRDGGYVVREGRFNQPDENGNERTWAIRWERAAFSTLDEALAWMKTNMVDRPSRK